MIGTLSSQVGLLAFAMAIFAGIYAGNSPFTVLSRALLIMVGAGTIGRIAAVAARAVLREYLQSVKVNIDRAHLDAAKAHAAAASASAGGEESPQAS